MSSAWNYIVIHFLSDRDLLVWSGLIFTTLLGASVGSFLNVVIYRLPEGKSLVWPRSACRHCGHILSWKDNLPVIAWVWLRGKCRYCKGPIHPQYVLVEAFTAALFGAWFYVCYMSPLRPDFAGTEIYWTASFFVAYLFLLGGLLAATLIDARYFIIPMAIPWTLTGAALVFLPAATLLPKHEPEAKLPPAAVNQVVVSVRDRLKQVDKAFRLSADVRQALERGWTGPYKLCAAPRVNNRQSFAAFGGVAGLAVAIGLLMFRVIPRSFDEPVTADPTKQDPYQWLEHPHPRLEILKECLFLSLPVAGFFIGLFAVKGDPTPLPEWLGVLGGIAMGFLVGGAVVWAVRILGTLGFGKEAMGLGDVHLMSAVGAICGWKVALIAFFVAPFFGVLWALGAIGWSKIRKREVRMIPFGPHLAVATVVVVVLKEFIFATHIGRILMQL